MNNRQKALLDIIGSTSVYTQEELQHLLKNAGFDVTQSTVSRDIKQLRVVKITDGAGKMRYAVDNGKRIISSGEKERYLHSYKTSAVSVDYALNNVVVKCHAGMASGACVVIDELYSEHLIGSLAGDDTIIIVTKNEEESAFLAGKLRELL